MKKIIQNLWRVVFVSVLVFGFQLVRAEGEQVNFLIKNNGSEVVSLTVALPVEGIASINDSEGNPHEVNARSVLNIVKNADDMSSGFNISSLIYYSSFNAFYLKCMDVSGVGDLCDGWQYNVNGDSPESGMDQSILSGGETVTVFFGSQEPAEEEVPAEEIAEPEVPEPHTFSGSRRSSVVVKNVEVLKAESPEVIEIKINPPKNEIVEKKIIPVKKVVPVKKPVIQNTASVLGAVSPVVVQSEPKQVSWFGKFWSWLFGN